MDAITVLKLYYLARFSMEVCTLSQMAQVILTWQEGFRRWETALEHVPDVDVPYLEGEIEDIALVRWFEPSIRRCKEALANWRKAGCPDDGDLIDIVGGEIESTNAFDWQHAVAQRHPHIRAMARAREEEMMQFGW
jgi:hypothetical protein